MTPGLRIYKDASCRIHAPDSVPLHLQPKVREVLSLQSETQGKGQARALMWRVCREADKARMVLMLTAKPYAEGMTVESLKRFYQHFGFFVATPAQPEIMLRKPK